LSEKEKMAMDMITNFTGPYQWLSNFYPAPITMGAEVWPTVEHYYQAMKTLDPAERERIRAAATPGQAKRMGAKVDLRDDWNLVKVSFMGYAVRQKFTEYDLLRQYLLQTGNAHLIEGNTWHDNFWGSCRCDDCRSAKKRNELGKILMAVRSTLVNTVGGNHVV